MEKLFAFRAALDERRVRYDLRVVREGVVMVVVVIPGEYLKIESFGIARSRSSGSSAKELRGRGTTTCSSAKATRQVPRSREQRDPAQIANR